jgi:protein gp37
MNATKIQYSDFSHNVITGCSNACCECREICWARRYAKRLEKNPSIPHRERYKDFTPAFWPERLGTLMRRKKPAVVALNFFGDMFSRGAERQWVDKTFSTIALTPHITYLCLTKRPDNALKYLRHADWSEVWNINSRFYWGSSYWPLPNVILGTSASDQATFDARIGDLLKCPGRHWLSLEPLRGPIQLKLDGIDWLAVGGGPEPMHPEWVRSIRDQCAAAGVPIFVKQLTENGKRIPFDEWPQDLQVREMFHAV